MAKHPAWKQVPGLVHAEQHAINAIDPSGNALRRVAEGFNYVSSGQKKLVLLRSQNLRAVSAGNGATPCRIWPCYFRTGENTNALTIRVGLAKVDVAFGPTGVPEFQAHVVDPGTASTVASVSHTFAGTKVGSVVSPSQIHYSVLTLTGLSADTEYRLDLETLYGCTVTYATVSEAEVRHADDSVTGVVSPAKYPVGGPIYDEHIADLITANNALWKHNGAHLLSWTCDYQVATTAAGVPAVLGPAGYADVAGAFHLPLAYRSTRNRTTVPVRMAVLAERTAGSGTLDVRLTDGTNELAVTGIGAGSANTWTVISGELPAADAGWWIQARTGSVSEFRLYGVSVFPYEA